MNLAAGADPASVFPYPFRQHQRELLDFLHRALAAGRHAVVESGTGTGKTACALTAALAVARERGKRVLYLTRTNSQAKQVILEYRRVRAKLADNIAPLGEGISGPALPTTLPHAVALQGRQHLCPLRRDDEEVAAADAEELGVMCRDRMRAAEAIVAGRSPKVPPCRYHLKGLTDGSDALVAWAREAAPEAEQIVARVEAAGQCPFVLTRSLMPSAELVVAPYVYFLHPHLRAQLYRAMGAAPQDFIVIVDEAHNLAAAARDLATARLTVRTLARAEAETRKFGDPTVLRDAPLSWVLAVIADTLRSLRDEHLPADDEDALIPPEELDVALLSALRTSTPGLERALVIMDDYAASVRESRRRDGKRPRSDVGSVVAFLRAWRQLDVESHAQILERDESEAALVLFALDPSILTAALNDVFATAHVSGTLQPLDEHRDSVGLARERSDLARFASPFPPENRLVVVDETVTTRHEDVAREPAMWARIGERLRDVRASTDRNLAVFLPSYDALHRLAPYVRAEDVAAVEAQTSRSSSRASTTFVETRGLAQDALMAQVAAFKATRGGTLLSVVGGRLSEGIDFPDDQLEVVILVGLPYAKPTAKLDALARFYERRFAQGWAWAVRTPMLRRVLQASGRLIRSPTDRGVVVLLDRRALSLRDALPEARATSDPAADVARFFGSAKL